jgi:2-hydroxycyclohexanecarboxyl-CoA dehydrogenase
VARNHLPGQTVSGYSAPADVADPAAVDAMVARVREDLGPVEVLVANAAEMVMGEIDQVSEEAFWRIVDVNLAGVFHCARACVPDMVAAGHGRIVAVSSEWGQIGWPRATAYSASKAGIISFVKALARQLGASGITANAVAPGAIDTSQLQVDAADAGEPIEELRRRYRSEAPLGRLGTPRDVAGAIAFLVSEHAGALTGQVLAPNGGTTR